VDSEKITNIEIYLSPIEKLKMTGMILDKKNGKPLHAEFDLFHDTDIIKDDVKILGEKGYSEIFTKYGWYLIEILSPGYLIETDTIWVMSLNRMELKKDYHLTPIETGMTGQLKNVYFNFETTNLDPDSFAELNNVVDFLKWNPSLKLEIGGHTDSEGPDDFNLILSQGRAQAVVDYLITQGINKSQLTAVGYGETKPLDKRDTKSAKAINRRVEFTVIKYHNE
jgi:outer membrane protein OmpA-like peptidoglycan-associated protein